MLLWSTRCNNQTRGVEEKQGNNKQQPQTTDHHRCLLRWRIRTFLLLLVDLQRRAARSANGEALRLSQHTLAPPPQQRSIGRARKHAVSERRKKQQRLKFEWQKYERHKEKKLLLSSCCFLGVVAPTRNEHCLD
jgi:hypothetical protein